MSSYGCFNRKPFPALIPLPAVQPISIDGYIVGTKAVQMVRNVFAKDCQYTLTDLGHADEGCIGCKWRKD